LAINEFPLAPKEYTWISAAERGKNYALMFRLSGMKLELCCREKCRPGPCRLAWLVLGLALISTPGCSVRRFAINKLGDALAQSGTTFASDDDPDFVKGAVPFSLKLIESLLSETPRHTGLLLAAASGFTQYSYAFVQADADELEEKDLNGATALRGRARKLYLRARNYGLRGLEVKHPGWEKALRANPKSAVLAATKSDVPFLYWTAAAWGSLISLSKDNPDLIADQPVVEALIDRALALDPDFNEGALHSFLITYESSRQGVTGDASVRSRQHFDRAMVLSQGRQAGPLVALAEAVSIKTQNVEEFKALLNRALAVKVEAQPESRLVNLVMQRRARWLLQHLDDLFLTGEPAAEKPK
jgi:predicted anti-sigma-YlaC factor YlaD